MTGAPRPLRVTPSHVLGSCMEPAWRNGDPCLIAWYDLSWPSLAALHGHLCVYVFWLTAERKARGSWGGILDHIESTWPGEEKTLVFRTINPASHETIRKLPLEYLDGIGQVYPLDEEHLIPEPLDPVETFIVDIAVPRPLRKPASAARPRAYAGGKLN